MEIPVSGFVVSSEDANGRHSHKLYITAWDGTPVHTHAFEGVTSVDDGHAHAYAGWTAPAPSGVPHVHGYHTVTALVHGHTHVIHGTTGPAVPLPGGGHFHEFEGWTTVDGIHPHAHAYRGRTGDEVGR
jgi:hypothetical protein